MAWFGRRHVLVVAVVAVVVVGGCGGGRSEPDKAKDSVTAFFAAVANDKGDDACVRLTPAGVRQISAAAFLLREPGSCRDAITALNRQLDSNDKKALKSVTVNKVTVAGNRATVAPSDIQIKVSGHAGLFRGSNAGPLQLEKVAGAWQISSLG